MPPSSPSAATLRQLAALIHPGGVTAPSGPIAGSLELVAAAREHRVAALVARALETRGELAGLDDAARAALRRALLDQQQERAQLDALGAVAAAALDAAGIPFVALKGAALGAAHYPAPALRPMTDVDLLVAPGDKDRALTALAAAGFVRPPPAQEAFWAGSFYNLPLDPPPGQAGKLELHWSIAQQGRHAPDVEGILARARAIETPAGRLPIPEAVDLLLHQSLHLSYHYFEPKLIWLHDLALLHRDPPDAAETLARAAAWGMHLPLALAAAQVERAFPGTVSPPFRTLAERSLRARTLLTWAGAGADEPLALLARWNDRRRQLVYAVATLDRPSQMVRALTSWARRAARHGDAAGRRKDPC
ncbi:MAG: nucleotidyltransferase family protein [Acidobacteria bacterium]|jgi:predicted DNA-binding ribbon-helix-helix protein|nr:nucleotidyltransferase family protein [Acidobacteriota bacterium]